MVLLDEKGCLTFAVCVEVVALAAIVEALEAVLTEHIVTVVVAAYCGCFPIAHGIGWFVVMMVQKGMILKQ
jgi:hypothetical protein